MVALAELHAVLAAQVALEVNVAITRTEALNEIAGIIVAVDNRCMAADGDVTPTNEEITSKELFEIYRLAIACYPN